MFFSTTLILAGLLNVETPDTLQAVTIVADRGVVVSRTDTLPVNPSKTITEFLLQSPATYVSDAGGYAGLKTVSIRGMGSPSTAIYIDGVRANNIQSGQGDLGNIGLENFSSAVLDYAQNSLSFVTNRPSFIDGRKVGGYARFAAGSFGTYLPSARLDWKLSNALTLSANADAVISNGDFPYGNGMVRENNDIRDIRAGLDLFGIIDGGDWHAKLWYNGSERGTPGSLSYPSTDRQKDRNAFAQGLVRKQFSSLYHLTGSAKVSYDDIYYTSSWGDSRYGQTEFQINTSHKFSINHWLVLSAAADVFWDNLKSTNYNQQRVGTTETISASFNFKRFRANVSAQYEGVFDKGQKPHNYVSPSVDLRLTAFEGFDIVAFAKKAYRVPTFNELYYVGYGNPDLNPEDAILSDLGIDWSKKIGTFVIKTKVDGYYNYLRDKIISYPSPEDPNIWRPYNIGQVRSAGADATAGFDYAHNALTVCFSAKYSYQDAVDKTPDSNTCNGQLAYIAKHSLTVNASARLKGSSAEVSWNLRAGRRDSYGEMSDWNTLDLFFRKSFNLGKAGIPAVKLTLKNITGFHYELTSGYPMPGFNVSGGIEYKF